MPIQYIAACALSAMALVAQTVEAGDDPWGNRSDKNVALGRKMAGELRGCTTAISSPIVQGLIDRLGRKLAAQLPKSDLTFTLNAIEEDLSRQIHEPIALPGGYIFIPAALFVAAQDEDEFAGMLAQAMAQSNVIEKDLSRLAAQLHDVRSAGNFPLHPAC